VVQIVLKNVTLEKWSINSSEMLEILNLQPYVFIMKRVSLNYRDENQSNNQKEVYKVSAFWKWEKANFDSISTLACVYVSY